MQPPFFSVIVPTHGRIAALNRCLQAIHTQNYRENYEVIVVFDGTPPPTFETQIPNIQLLTQPKRGPAAARNLGAMHAQGNYLAFTDDDCIPTPDWLSQLSVAFHQYPNRMIGGQVINILPNNHYAAASQLLVDYFYDQYNANPLQPHFFTSNNLALPRHLFLELDGFDTRFPLAAGEDRELCSRWLQRGQSMFYQPTALVHHAHELDLTGFWRQHFNYGRGAYRFRKGETGVAFEELSFYLGLLRYPLKRVNGRPAFNLFVLFLLMQLANTAGFLYETTASRF